MSAFTKGPWRLDGTSRAVEATAFDGSWKYVCDKVRGGSAEQADTNARLIAAAPEMYEALRYVLDYFEHEAYADATWAEKWHEFDALMADIDGGRR